MVTKVFEKYVNKKLTGYLDKYGLSSDFRYGFKSSQWTADLLTIVSESIARAFNRSGATRQVALDISKAFHRVWHTGLLHKLNSYGISGQIIRLILSFLSNRRRQVALSRSFHKNIQLMLEFLNAPFLVLDFLLYINDLPNVCYL